MSDVDVKLTLLSDSVHGYLMEHKCYVTSAWHELYKQPVVKALLQQPLPRIIEFNIQNHDMSMFSDEEFPGLCDFFRQTPNYKETYSKSVKHHVAFNPHHWEFWVNGDSVYTVSFDLRVIYLVEMVVDWMAITFKSGDQTIFSYYNSQLPKMKLDSQSQALLHKLVLAAMETESQKLILKKLNDKLKVDNDESKCSK